MSSLTQRVASNFRGATRSKGNNYFYRDLVYIVRGDDRSAIATIGGGDEYSVDLATQGRLLGAFCTCPHSQTAYCEHIWATILAAESKGFLRASGTVRSMYRLDSRLDSVPVEVSPEPPPSKERPSSLILGIKESETQYSEASTPQRQILYLINVPDSLVAGDLVVDIAIRWLSTNGEWGKVKTRSAQIMRYSQLADDADRQILAHISGNRDQHQSCSLDDLVPPRCRLVPPLDRTLIPMMCRTRRCRLRFGRSTNYIPSVKWDDCGEWEFWLVITRDDKCGRYVIRGQLRRGDRRMSLSEPALLTVGGMVFAQRHASLLDYSGAFDWISHLRKHGQMDVPPGAKERAARSTACYVCPSEA
jgi:hypothetical protein